MRCVITGGAGFIGGHLSSGLQRAGHEVLVLDIAWQPDSELPGVAADICDTGRIIEIFEDFRPDTIFHLAGVADARAALEDPVSAVQVNVTGTASVLDAARRAGVERVILASSCWVNNAMPVGFVDETEPFLPTGGGHVYTTTMIARELLAHDFRRLYGLSFTVLRYSPVYGPGMWPGLALGAFIRAARVGGPIVVFGDGLETRAFLYVDDLVDAFIRAALMDIARDQVYNIQGPRSVTVNELAQRVSTLFGGVKVVYRDEPSRRGELRHRGRTISCEKAKRDLGWTPKVDIEEGIIRVLAASGLLPEHISGMHAHKDCLTDWDGSDGS